MNAPAVEKIEGTPASTTPWEDCDACGRLARGVVKVTLVGGGTLFFCGHHSRGHGPALIAQGAVFARLPGEAFTPGLEEAPQVATAAAAV